MYALCKYLFIYQTITDQQIVALEISHLMKMRKTMLISNVLSGDLSFFLYIRTDTDNKLSYSQKKNLGIDQRKLDLTRYWIGL